MEAVASLLAKIPIQQLKGVGPKLAEKLAKLNILTVQDLLFHLPYRYQDRTHVTPIRQCRANQYHVIEGVVLGCEVNKRGRKSFIVKLQDPTGTMQLRFFNFYQSHTDQLQPGVNLRCFAEVKNWRGLEMIHPEYSLLDPTKNNNDLSERLTPIYSSTEGLGQTVLRKLVSQGLDLLTQGGVIQEFIPIELLKNLNLPDLPSAIRLAHFPPSDCDINLLLEGLHPIQRRLALDELVGHQLSMLQLRDMVIKEKSEPLIAQNNLINQFKTNLPFKLTNAQSRVLKEISEDLAKPNPMLRLLQGDVGSGKTVVAAIAMLQAVESGMQACLMAPTEILAEQHYKNLSQWLEPLGVKLAWLSGSQGTKYKRSNLENIQMGIANIIIGTHAVFQDQVNFKNLGFIVIDEQHRFGVHQRLALQEKGKQNGLAPHQLIMTATPIPRTLAMTAYADLAYSVIDELPPGRKAIQTIVLNNSKRNDVINRIKQFCENKQQVYWVCTLIEESEHLQCQAAEDTEKLLKQQLPHLSIGLVHGRLQNYEKDKIMQDFHSHKIDLLVATTVIEVGVDVPNASLMIIDNAERLGLSQLHQLRGRVGRGSNESFCVLLYQAPLSRDGQYRLGALRDSTDGFVIAEKDLRLRGPGELLGTRQTGLAQFRVANLERDEDLIDTAQKLSQKLIKNYPEQSRGLILRWCGERQQYVSV